MFKKKLQSDLSEKWYCHFENYFLKKKFLFLIRYSATVVLEILPEVF